MTIEDWGAGATIDGTPVPAVPDLAGMRAARRRRLQDHLAAKAVDGLVLSGSGAVAYATGAASPGDDAGRAMLFRPMAVVVAGDPDPHLFTAWPDGAPADLPEDHVHGPLLPDLDDGVEQLAGALGDLVPPGARVGADDLPHPMARALDTVSWVDASSVLGPARLRKTPDEVACIRQAQRINELAMLDAWAALRPGIRQSDLSAVFLDRAFALGASAGSIDPIWQVMAPHLADGPWASHGGLAYPMPTTDRFLREGDVIWVDAGLLYEGYASDYGRTWITSAGSGPTARQQDQFRRWRAVVDAALDALTPGATSLDLVQAATAAAGGDRPWMAHFYLAHGVGTESAELPLVGTDLGDAYDGSQVLEPGTVLVLEPVVWDEGAAGYRSEDIVAVTDTGWVPLSGTDYRPFDLS